MSFVPDVGDIVAVEHRMVEVEPLLLSYCTVWLKLVHRMVEVSAPYG